MIQSTPRYPTTPMCDGPLLEAFEPTTRDTDVFVSTAAKCGQTWLLTLLYHLETRGRQPDLGGRGLHSITPWLEIPFDMFSRQPHDRATRLAELEALDAPRIFKLHVLWEEIPRPASSSARVLTVTRDPRDLPFSMYSHLAGMKTPQANQPPVGDFDSYFERWMSFGYYFAFVRSFWPHRDDPALLWLRYEDMKRDLAGEARRIVAFLGWDVTDSDLARVLPLASFEHMQRTERTALFAGADDVWRDDARFVREGGVGQNRARLTPEQERRIVTRARTEFEPACFDWVMSQGA